MTLCQLRYIDMIAKRDTLTTTTEALFVIQPSLTAALRELGQEPSIALFLRSRKGLSLTPAEEEFLDYTCQTLDQVPLVKQRYTGEARGYRHFCVSSQHYSSVIEASVALLGAYGGSQYEPHMRGTETYHILEDVVRVRLEVNALYRNQFNAAVLQRNLQEMKLPLTPICRVKPHAFLGAQHPLTKEAEISMEDLRDYPHLSYGQGRHNSSYFSGEIQSVTESDKDIMVCDHATLLNLSVGTNDYTICSGIINTELNSKNTVTCPFAVDDYVELGYVLSKEHPTSDLTLTYINLPR